METVDEYKEELVAQLLAMPEAPLAFKILEDWGVGSLCLVDVKFEDNTILVTLDRAV